MIKILYPGHRYAIEHLDGDGETIIQFVQRAPLHEPKEGILSQDLLRVLIGRVEVLNAEIPSPLNSAIVDHLRQALCLFEARALIRKAEKGQLLPENLPVGTDGHFLFQQEGS